MQARPASSRRRSAADRPAVTGRRQAALTAAALVLVHVLVLAVVIALLR